MTTWPPRCALQVAWHGSGHGWCLILMVDVTFQQTFAGVKMYGSPPRKGTVFFWRGTCIQINGSCAILTVNHCQFTGLFNRLYSTVIHLVMVVVHFSNAMFTTDFPAKLWWLPVQLRSCLSGMSCGWIGCQLWMSPRTRAGSYDPEPTLDGQYLMHRTWSFHRFWMIFVFTLTWGMLLIAANWLRIFQWFWMVRLLIFSNPIWFLERRWSFASLLHV